MKINKESIKIIDQADSVFDQLSGEMSRSYVVGIASRIFSYEDENLCFELKDLRKIFYGVADKYRAISGSIVISSYSETMPQVFSSFSNPQSHIEIAEIEIYTEIFWQEVATHFTMPPTHVYIHEPTSGSVFDFGVFWQFCYIYLNDKTKQGIVIAADASD